MKPWSTAYDATLAPRTDLTLLALLRNYHYSVGSVAAAKLDGHLWYISPELVSLTLFDDLVPSTAKQAMVQAMQEKEKEKDTPERVKVRK